MVGERRGVRGTWERVDGLERQRFPLGKNTVGRERSGRQTDPRRDHRHDTEGDDTRATTDEKRSLRDLGYTSPPTPEACDTQGCRTEVSGVDRTRFGPGEGDVTGSRPDGAPKAPSSLPCLEDLRLPPVSLRPPDLGEGLSVTSLRRTVYPLPSAHEVPEEGGTSWNLYKTK